MLTLISSIYLSLIPLVVLSLLMSVIIVHYHDGMALDHKQNVYKFFSFN